MTRPQLLAHPAHPNRRVALQAGAIGLLGLGMNHVSALHAAASESADAGRQPAAKAVIYIFLSGGLSQIDSFDMKPGAPETVRGEFQPIATRTPGVEICEHLPLLARQSHRFTLVRSLAHGLTEHSQGHMSMLSGRTAMPPLFSASQPKPTDWPSIAAVAGALTAPRNNLPPAVVLPETLIHRTGRVIPGQFAGQMGTGREPMFLEMSAYSSTTYGASPEYTFHHQTGKLEETDYQFEAPSLSLPEGVKADRFARRLNLLENINAQRQRLDRLAEQVPLDRYRQEAVALLSDPKTQAAFDYRHADPRTLERYGNNKFGWSLLVARQLVEAGVNLVQVNLGNNETWDNHGNIFPHLRDLLFPPTDRAVSALLEDLAERGLLDSTLVVMGSEMGRTPKIAGVGRVYKLPGRDHWGTQSVLLVGGGVRGGQVIGATDNIGAYPVSQPQTPENLGATIYQALGLPRTTHWQDSTSRPHFIYHGEPIAGLS